MLRATQTPGHGGTLDKPGVWLLCWSLAVQCLEEGTDGEGERKGEGREEGGERWGGKERGEEKRRGRDEGKGTGGERKGRGGLLSSSLTFISLVFSETLMKMSQCAMRDFQGRVERAARGNSVGGRPAILNK